MTGRRALAWGAAAAAAWVLLAAISASLSPVARRPLLDGTITGAEYRWVDPPPELEPTNVPPSGAGFEIGFDGGESEADVVFTPDNQVTLVATTGMLADPRARTLRLDVTPEASPSAGALPAGLAPFGNAIRIEAETTPGGAVERFDSPMTLVLVYPATPNLHATEHEILWSADDGATWTRLDTTDSPGAQQAQAEIEAPGTVVVAGIPSAPPEPGGTGETGGTRDALSTVLLVVAGGSLLIGIGLLVRARGRED